ncbi:hypothetical protein HID58_025879 [Brassica napus]|uniref:Uncharacterized protein n=1 Tax=Brassica napus TaxID=3708 RepID=A0ABQ8CMD1_BRANA|nr:hypothetical protein HID58_025879 [Brassica napus]
MICMNKSCEKTHSRADKDTTYLGFEELVEKIWKKRTRLTEASGGSGDLTGERVSTGKCLFGGRSGGGLGYEGGGRAVTIIFKEEEQWCIKPRNDVGRSGDTTDE